MVFTYPVRLASDEGAITVEFPDFPEAHTYGTDPADALMMASDCLEAAVATRMIEGEELPRPSVIPGAKHVMLGAQMAAKAHLYCTMREAGISKLALSKALGRDEKHVRRLLDPGHESTLESIEAALAVLGKRLQVQVLDAA